MIRSDTLKGQRSEDSSDLESLLGHRWQVEDPLAGFRMEAEEEEEEEEEDDESEEESEEDEDDQSSKKGKGKASDDAISRAEHEKALNRMKNADRRADAAEKKLKEIEDKDKTDLEKAQSDLKAVTKERDELLEDNVELSVRLAVLTAKDAGKFHDPEDVLRFVDFDDLTDEDGTIDKGKVKEALKDLSKSKPHLVRSASNGDGGDDDEEEEDEKPPSSGRSSNKKRSKKANLDKARLMKKYPALRR